MRSTDNRFENQATVELISISRMADQKQIGEKMDGATKKPGDAYIAKPSGECCLKGTIHDGESRGSFESIADVETYVVKPKDGQGNGNIILYYADVWGMFNNGYLIMDGFADRGYTVLGLDYFRGVSFDLD